MTDTTKQFLRDQAEALLTGVKSGATDAAPFDINHFVHRLLACDRKIAAIWCIEDVQGIRPDLTADQAWGVLERVGDKHDAEHGISWTTLECVADDLFGHPSEVHNGQEA